MCTRTSKNKGQSGRRLNTLVAFFEISFKILKSFWDLYFVFLPKHFKNGPILGCLWLFGAQKFMLFYALMIHETNHDDVFLLNSRSTFLNCSKLLKENYISILLWPNRNKNPAILWKNDRKWLNHANMWLFDFRSWKKFPGNFCLSGLLAISHFLTDFAEFRSANFNRPIPTGPLLVNFDKFRPAHSGIRFHKNNFNGIIGQFSTKKYVPSVSGR